MTALTPLTPDRRRFYVALRYGLWQAEADGRGHVAYQGFKITRLFLEERREMWERKAAS